MGPVTHQFFALAEERSDTRPIAARRTRTSVDLVREVPETKNEGMGLEFKQERTSGRLKFGSPWIVL
jgi:hypothetical protein